MGGIVVVPYGRAHRHYFSLTERTGADFLAPAWEAGESQWTQEVPEDTWSVLSNTATPVVHPRLTDHFGVLFAVADLTCRRLIHRVKDATGTKAWNDDSWELRTEGHHNAFYSDKLLLHAGAVQAVGASSLTLENTPYPANVPPGSLIRVKDSGGIWRVAIAGSTYNPSTGLLSISLPWPALPTLPAEYYIVAAPEVPGTVPADLVSVAGDVDAATGMKWAGRQTISTQVVAGVLSVNQFSTALTKSIADYYRPRAFYFDGGALDKYMGFVESYDFVGGLGLISPALALPLIPAVNDKLTLM